MQQPAWYSRQHFNSQPHEEADMATAYCQTGSFDISTHSLTKRLTDPKKEEGKDDEISTHSLTKRLTGRLEAVIHSQGISTHSLTKRLTQSDIFFIRRGIFQLTASRRG